MSEQEKSASGAPIYRYDDVQPKEFTPATGDWDNISLIADHIEKHAGKVDCVFHEIVSDIVHIDVHWIKPSEEFPYHVLVTSGMSDLPMNVPGTMKGHEYAEVCALLPAEWKIEEAGPNKLMTDFFKDEASYWPIRWLKKIARFPHEYNTWMSNGHSLPNGEEAEPFADNTKLGCILLLPSLSLGTDFFKLDAGDGKTIRFYCLYPLYKEEMELKLNKGTDALLDKFEKYKISDVIDVSRRNTCVKKGLFGLW